MYFAKATLFLSLAISGMAMPMQKRADLLQAQDYSQFQISDGVAGNALAEVAEKFPIKKLQADLAGVSDADLAILHAAHRAAEEAEASAGGFDAAIKEVGEDSDDGQSLSVGKTKNSILGQQLKILALQVEQAKGQDTQSQIDQAWKKLASSVASDKERVGDQSQSINFAGSSEPSAKI